MRTEDHIKDLFLQQHFASHTSKQARHASYKKKTVAVMAAITPDDWCNDTQRLPSNKTRHRHYSHHYPHSHAPCMCEWYGHNNNGGDNAAIP